MPKIANNGHSASPAQTPNASGQADLKPPDIARASKATQTGPGVRNNITTANA